MEPQRHLLDVESQPILHDELIADILSRLPVKSLMRFQCICKSWKSLISNPQFVKLHLRRSSAKDGDLSHLRLLIERKVDDSGNEIVSSCSYNELIENPTTVVDEQNSNFPLKNKYRAIGTCNGLISFASVQLGDGKADEGSWWVRFWNPATRSKSPKSPYLYHPGIEPVNFGFGFDPSSGTYKVVALRLSVDDEIPHPVKVYNMGSNSWRSIPTFPIYPSPFHSNGIYLNGALIFSGRHYKNDLDRVVDWDKFAIVSLDLGAETYEELPMPPLDMSSVSMPSLDRLRDCLSFSHVKNYTHFVLWKFGVNKSWTCLFNLSYDYLSNFPQCSRCVLLCMSGNGNVLLLIEDDVVLYDLTENRVELLVEFPTNIYCYHKRNYVESLVSPYGN